MADGELSAAERAYDNWADGPSDRESSAFYAGFVAAEADAQQRIAELEAALGAILEHIHYERDINGSWHSFYTDKYAAAEATERARAALAEPKGGAVSAE